MHDLIGGNGHMADPDYVSSAYRGTNICLLSYIRLDSIQCKLSLALFLIPACLRWISFFLHHCNVDRLFALWEYLYPNCYVRRITFESGFLADSILSFSCKMAIPLTAETIPSLNIVVHTYPLM